MTTAHMYGAASSGFAFCGSEEGGEGGDMLSWVSGWGEMIEASLNVLKDVWERRGAG